MRPCGEVRLLRQLRPVGAVRATLRRLLDKYEGGGRSVVDVLEGLAALRAQGLHRELRELAARACERVRPVPVALVQWMLREPETRRDAEVQIARDAWRLGKFATPRLVVDRESSDDESSDDSGSTSDSTWTPSSASSFDSNSSASSSQAPDP